MIKIILLGAGNVGNHLYKAFSKSSEIDLIQWYCRDSNSISFNNPNTEIINELSELKDADVYIISISDSYIGEISKQIKISGKLVVHTSGSVDYTEIDDNITKVPICIESEENQDLILLEEISKNIGCESYKINFNQRKTIHLAAIFSNNFVNHMFTIAKDLLDAEDLNFNILKPLIDETVNKIHKLDPESAQTGPAIRNNNEIILNHIKALKKDDQKKLYELMTKLIQEKHGE